MSVTAPTQGDGSDPMPWPNPDQGTHGPIIYILTQLLYLSERGHGKEGDTIIRQFNSAVIVAFSPVPWVLGQAY